MSQQSARFAHGNGGQAPYLILEVIDIDDPEQRGRVKCRVKSYQNDKALIPDDQCFWAMPKTPVTNANKGGVGEHGTGAQVGSTLMGFWGDADRQMLIADGSFPAAGKQGKDGKPDASARNHDLPPAARDNRVAGSGDKRFKNDNGSESTGTFEDKPITQYAVDEAKDTYGGSSSKEGHEAGFALSNHAYA